MLDLGTRMKQYENNTCLEKKCPVIIRLDMRAGHTFTKGFKRPFDDIFIKSMQETAKYLCENVENCVLSYQQSDEVSLLLIDYKTPETGSWFDYREQKMCSIAASMATMAFNKAFSKEVDRWKEKAFPKDYLGYNTGMISISDAILFETYIKAQDKGAMFDARCFNLPQDEVTNYFYLRQLDAIRNSIQMVGQANFSHKELQYKSCNDIKEMLIDQKNIDWTSLPLYQQHGSCCIKTDRKTTATETSEGVITATTDRPHWIIDTDIPIFKDTLFKDNRNYINQYVYVGENNEKNEK